jgi:ribosome-binding protein aMBF1 (putative translation factor)
MVGGTRHDEQSLTVCLGRASPIPLLNTEPLMARSFDGAALRDTRRLAGIPAAQLAAAVGRSEHAVWSYETGRIRPPLDVAAGLADALDVRLEQLLATTETAVA